MGLPFNKNQQPPYGNQQSYGMMPGESPQQYNTRRLVDMETVTRDRGANVPHFSPHWGYGTSYAMAQQYGIKNIDELRAAVASGKIPLEHAQRILVDVFGGGHSQTPTGQ